MTKASDNAFPSILITEGTEPSAPAAGKQRLYIDSTTHKLKRTDSSGTDVTIEAAGGSVATDTIFDAKGDLAAGTGADTASKLTVGANGTILIADSTQSTGLAWVALASARYLRTSGDYTITGAGSTAFANVDGTNLSLTITTGARPVRIIVAATGQVNNTAGAIGLDVELDGSRLGGSTGGLLHQQQQVASKNLNFSFTWKTAALSAASHTFKLQWAQANTSHTATLRGSDPYLLFAVEECIA